MKILFIEPFYTGSHKSWLDDMCRFSSHECRILTMPGRFWKWRMHGGAVTLAREYLNLDFEPDLLCATDMLDFTTFLSLTRHKTARLKTACYFHENQLTYPWSETDRDIKNRREMHYVFINYVSALASDRVFFNSAYHLESFTGGLPGFLKSFPEYNELSTASEIREKSRVLSLGLDLRRFDSYREQGEVLKKKHPGPLFLWNHRWEYDKNPVDFFAALVELKKKGYQFQVAVLGEQFGKLPPVFDDAARQLGSRIVKMGYAESFGEYAAWLWAADFLPVTSNQDFFGISIMEAAYCGCVPILPRRLTYPELFSSPGCAPIFYEKNTGLTEKLIEAVFKSPPPSSEPFETVAAAYDWQHMIKIYDKTFASLIENKNG